ncbi:MAG: glycosyltransferase family 9 protein [Abditibacteriales bacterium]|nr:glycosyltransferase family 9 protein [Abditibacteriales bacterium]MDW8365834.1 glycosyltransferase family 9 protein [Abditibacteriales bacterium]
MKILILKLSAIGDCVLASPVSVLLRHAFPQAHIAWVVQERCCEVVEGNPFLDEVIVWRKGPPLRSLLDVTREVRARRFDVLLDLQGILKSSLLVWFSNVPTRLTGGRSRMIARWAATRTIPEPDRLHPLERYLHRAKTMCEMVRGPGSIINGQWSMVMPVTEEDRRFAESFLRAAGVTADDVLIGFNPGASRESKRWDAAQFAQVIDEVVAQHSAKPLVFGGPSDVQQCEKVLSLTRSPLISAVGKTTLKQFAALAARCRAFVTCDTGPMHIAAAMNVPVVAIYRPTTPKRITPYGEQHIVLPRDGAAREVTAAEVIEAIGQQLSSQRAAADAAPKSLLNAPSREGKDREGNRATFCVISSGSASPYATIPEGRPSFSTFLKIRQ